MTCSIPLSGDSRPNVRITDLPSTPSRSLLLPMNGTLGIPCGIRSILASATPWISRSKLGAVRAHDDDALRELDELVHRDALQRIRLGENRMQRRHDRHSELAKKREHVAARLAAEDSVLVLHADDVDRVDVQKIRRAPVRGEIAVGDLEAHTLGVLVMPAGVVHRDDEAVDAGSFHGDRVAQIGSEGGDAAFTRQMISYQRESLNRVQ